MSEFSEVIGAGLERIYQEDWEVQSKFISKIAEMRDTTPSAINLSKAVFIPNDNYLAHFCGDRVRDYAFDCYFADGTCKWNNYLIFPITNVSGEIVALGGFNPMIYLNARNTGDYSTNYYQYSSSKIYKKGSYLYSTPKHLIKSIQEGYLFLVDGYFDCLSLQDAGFNSAAILSSTVTPEILVQLRFVKRVILASDNDSAGLKLYHTLKKQHHGLELLKHNLGKDIDEVLRADSTGEFKKKLRDIVNHGTVNIELIRKRTLKM